MVKHWLQAGYTDTWSPSQNQIPGHGMHCQKQSRRCGSSLERVSCPPPWAGFSKPPIVHGYNGHADLLTLQVRQVILDLLGSQLPEAGALGTLDALDAEEMVRRGSDDA
jgi:hypothetical protein